MRYLSLLLIFLSALCFASGETRSPEQQKIEFLEQRVQELRTENQKLSDKFDKIDATIKQEVDEKTAAYDKLNSQSVAGFNSLVSLLQTALIIASFLIAVLTLVGWSTLKKWMQEYVEALATKQIELRVSDEFLVNKIDGKSQAAMNKLDADVAAKAEQLFVRYENELKARLAEATKDAAAIAELKQQNIQQPLTPTQKATAERLEAKAEQTPETERTQDDWFLLGLHAWQTKNYHKALEYFEKTHTSAGLGNAALAAEKAKQIDKAEDLYQRAIEAAPKNAVHLSNFAVFLTDIRQEHDQAEVMYRRAIDADPQHANSLGNFALFLSEIRKDYGQAENMYRRALEADPENVTTLINFAECLLLQGRQAEGAQRLAQAEQIESITDQEKLAINLCRYALIAKEHTSALKALKTLLQSGARDKAFSCELIIQHAEKAVHPDLELLKHLALVVNDKATLDELNQYPAWQNT